MNILIDLEPSESFSDNELMEDINNLDIQFDKQVTNKVSDVDLSNQQEFEQTPEIRDLFVWKNIFAPNLSLI